MFFTGPLPDFTFILKIRGYLLKPAFKTTGKNFQIASGVIINWSSNVVLGNDVFIGNNCWIQGRGGIQIDDEVLIGPFSVIATNNHTKKGKSFRFGEGVIKPIYIGFGSWLGAHCIITSGVKIGNGVMVAAGSVVTTNIPDYKNVGGVPAKTIDV
jgi:maltose O-acetyltransferase